MTSVFVLEDDPDLRNLYTRALKHKGYEVDQAESAEKAVAALSQSRPDIAVLDMSMPGLPGTVVVEYIRHHSSTPNLPIIVISCNEDYRQELLWADIMFIKKPINLSDLYTAVARKTLS